MAESDKREVEGGGGRLRTVERERGREAEKSQEID